MSSQVVQNLRFSITPFDWLILKWILYYFSFSNITTQVRAWDRSLSTNTLCKTTCQNKTLVTMSDPRFAPIVERRITFGTWNMIPSQRHLFISPPLPTFLQSSGGKTPSRLWIRHRAVLKQYSSFWSSIPLFGFFLFGFFLLPYQSCITYSNS